MKEEILGKSNELAERMKSQVKLAHDQTGHLTQLGSDMVE